MVRLLATLIFPALASRQTDDDTLMLQTRSLEADLKHIQHSDSEPHERIIGGHDLEEPAEEEALPEVTAEMEELTKKCDGMTDEQYGDLIEDKELEVVETEKLQTTQTTTLAPGQIAYGAKLLDVPAGALALKFIDAVHDVTTWVHGAVVQDQEVTASSPYSIKKDAMGELQGIMGDWVDTVNKYHDCGDGIVDAIACAEITKCVVAEAVEAGNVSRAVFASVIEMEELLITEYLPVLENIFLEDVEKTDFVCSQLDLGPDLSLVQLSSTFGMASAATLQTTLHVGRAVARMASMDSNSSLSTLADTWQKPCAHLGCDHEEFTDVVHHLHGHTVTLIQESAHPAVLHSHIKSSRKAVHLVKKAMLEHSDRGDLEPVKQILYQTSKPDSELHTDRYNEHLTEVGGIMDGANLVQLQRDNEELETGDDVVLEVEDEAGMEVDQMESEEGTYQSGWGRRRRRWFPRRRRRWWKAITKVVTKVVKVVVKTATQIVKEIHKFVRNLLSCLGIGISTAIGWGVGPQATIGAATISASIGIGYAGGGWAWDGSSRRRGWSYSSSYMNNWKMAWEATRMLTAMLAGRSFCLDANNMRQLEIGAGLAIEAANCRVFCTKQGIGASTKFPRHGRGRCMPWKFDHIMAAYTTAFEALYPGAPPIFGIPATKSWGFSVAASCCMANVDTNKVECGWR